MDGRGLIVARSMGIGEAGKMSMDVKTYDKEFNPKVKLTSAEFPISLQAKINPYLRPLLDALHDMMPAEDIQKHRERGTIEIAPLAYMRGRTLNNAFIILDEAQNSTTEQMLMFLTRLGEGAKMVITGDPSQVDLPKGKTGEAAGPPGEPRGARGGGCGQRDVRCPPGAAQSEQPTSRWPEV